MVQTRSQKRNASPSPERERSPRPSKRVRKSEPAQRTVRKARRTRQKQEKEKEKDIQEEMQTAGNQAVSPLISLPTELLLTVANYMYPADLLAISRVCKHLRSIFMSKNVKAIWVAAEKALDLPPCPSDLSHPQHASLVFDNFCMVCLAKRRDADFALRVRLCIRCQKTQLVPIDHYLSETCEGYNDIKQEFTTAVVNTKITRILQHYHNTHSIDSALALRGQPKFYGPVLQSKLEEYKKLRSEKEKKEFVARGVINTCDMYNHSERLNVWVTKMAWIEEQIDEVHKEQRRTMINERLLSLGYDEDDISEDIDESYWKWSALVDQPIGLNDEIWNSLLPRLVKIIHRRREKRARLARLDCIERRKDKISELALSFLSSAEGTRANLCHGELIELPMVDEYIKAEGLDEAISADVAEYVRDKMLELGDERTKRIEDLFASAMYDTLSKLDLLPPGCDWALVAEQPMTILNCSWAFFEHQNYHVTFSASTIMESVHCHTEITYTRLGYQIAPSLYRRYEVFKPDNLHIMTAKKLLERVDGDHPSMEFSQLVDTKYRCHRCASANGINWPGMVAHFARLMNTSNNSHDLDDETLCVPFSRVVN